MQNFGKMFFIYLICNLYKILSKILWFQLYDLKSKTKTTSKIHVEPLIKVLCSPMHMSKKTPVKSLGAIRACTILYIHVHTIFKSYILN